MISNKIILFIIVIFIGTVGWSQTPDSAIAGVFAMNLEDLVNTKVSIATKSDQPVIETPSNVSVITSDEIKNMGARNLEDILQTIPGFDVLRMYNGYYSAGVRGVKDNRVSSNKILLLFDGVAYNQIFYGSSLRMGNNLNMDNVERIEIIRGPGSALYGRNAFNAVINVITKTGKSDDKPFIKATYGTCNTRDMKLYYGLKKKKINASVALFGLNADSPDEKYDGPFGRKSRLNTYNNNYVVSTNLGFKKFTLSCMYSDLDNGATLTKTFGQNKVFSYILGYNSSLTPKITIRTKFYGHNEKSIENIENIEAGLNVLLPASMGGNGTITYADIWPMGIYLRPEFNTYMYGGQTELNYAMFAKNNFLVGLQADFYGVKNVKLYSNVSDFTRYTPIAGIDRSNVVLYEPGWFDKNGHHYSNLAFYLQDIWQPTKLIDITLGGRFDYDSEIGVEINPRLGLVIKPMDNLFIKLLYGRAYRAPSPSEQFQTLGFAIGNKNLHPEIINTCELAIIHSFKKMVNSISIFRNNITDKISSQMLSTINPLNKYYNIGKNKSTGVEFENRLVLSKDIYTFLNYSYTVSKNTDTIFGTYDQPDVAPHKLNAGLNYSFLKYFNININMYFRSQMGKYYLVGPSGNYLKDPVTNEYVTVQDNIGDYALVNSTFQVKNLFKGASIIFTVLNLFDKKYYSQNNQLSHQPPQAGRQFFVSLAYVFK